jgi:hypothetical protein
MIRIVSMLCVAAVLGVVAATFCTCGIGLVSGTSTWCGLPLFWFIGFPMAIVSALVFGAPVAFIYRRFGLVQWWQFVLGATIAAIPFWFELAEPFDSPRWKQSGFFDSLNYLGSGAFAGLFYWWFVTKFQAEPPSNPSLHTDPLAGQ